jgi:hypothetical protein
MTANIPHFEQPWKRAIYFVSPGDYVVFDWGMEDWNKVKQQLLAPFSRNVFIDLLMRFFIR